MIIFQRPPTLYRPPTSPGPVPIPPTRNPNPPPPKPGPQPPPPPHNPAGGGGPSPGQLAAQDASVMATTSSTTAPVTAAATFDDNEPSFFSSGSGPASQYSFSQAGGVGQEEQAPEAGQ